MKTRCARGRLTDNDSSWVTWMSPECAYELPDGRVLLDDVSFRVGDGAKVALVGANGAGKTTLLRIITGDLVPHAGVVTRTGGLGVMRQMVGTDLGDDPTVADLLLSVSPAAGPRGLGRRSTAGSSR